MKNGYAELSYGTIQAEINTDTGHHIHGGSKGSCNKNWRILEQSKSYVVLEVLLPDGEMGFPGNLTTQVRYELLPNASLKINISARTDGSLIQYDAAAGKFKVKSTVEDTGSLLKINGGSF